MIGNSLSLAITCKTVIPITSVSGMTLSNVLFQVKNSSLPVGSLAAGISFSFPVVFNLTGYVVKADNTGLPVLTPSIQTSVVNVLTVNGQSGYSTQMPILVSGKAESLNPDISVNPIQVSFPALVIGSADGSGSVSTLTINNIGSSPMKILSYAFASGQYTGDADSVVNNITTQNGISILDTNGYFTSSNLPPVGTIIQGDSGLSVDLFFNTTVCELSKSIFH